MVTSQMKNALCVHLKSKANYPQFQTYLLDIIDIDHLSIKSDISKYVQDVKLTITDDMFNVMHLNVLSLTKRFDKLKWINSIPTTEENLSWCHTMLWTFPSY